MNGNGIGNKNLILVQEPYKWTHPFKDVDDSCDYCGERIVRGNNHMVHYGKGKIKMVKCMKCYKEGILSD